VTASTPLLAGRYEEIRREALDREDTQPFGRAVFMRHGMAVWMQECARVGPPQPLRDTRLELPQLPAGLRGEMVMLLAEMTLGLGQEEAST
jgi:hypothetical protein